MPLYVSGMHFLAHIVPVTSIARAVDVLLREPSHVDPKIRRMSGPAGVNFSLQFG